MCKGFRNILFDLDGTITDPFLGITNCIRYALDKLKVPKPENLKWCIGPPLLNSFRTLLEGHSSETADQALVFYRERFSTQGIFENEIYDGIAEMLKSLTHSGYRLYVATSKPQVYAIRIIEYFGLKPCFYKVYGSELDGSRCNKADLIKYIFESEGISSTNSIMIGDRKHDLIGARINKMKSIGVTWGYGDLEELEKEQPEVIFHTPGELMAYFCHSLSDI